MFQLDKYMDEILEKLSEEKIYIVYTFLDDYGNKQFKTYSLEHFKKLVITS